MGIYQACPVKKADIGLVLSCVLIDLVELGQYPAILTYRLVNNLYLLKLLFMVHKKYSIIPKTLAFHKCPVWSYILAIPMLRVTPAFW